VVDAVAGNWSINPTVWTDLEDIRTYHSSVIYRGSAFIVGGTKTGIEVVSLQTGEQTYFPFPGPSERTGQAVVQYDDNLYLFGGRDEETGDLLNDLWVADLTPGGVQWILLSRDGYAPVPGRAFHSAVLYQDSIYIFGGEQEEGFGNDIWRYDIGRDWWVRVVTNQIEEFLPTPRAGHVAVYWVNEHLYIWGGYNEVDGYLDDMWAFDFQEETWSRIYQGKLIPTARAHAAYDIRNDLLILTGGQITISNTHEYFWNPWLHFLHLPHESDYAADFWAFDFETNRWELIGCRLVDDGEIICESDHAPECPNDCTHNGVCIADGECVCFSEWKGEDCSENNCETHLGYHVELMDRILITESLLKLSKRLTTLRETLLYIEETLPEWDELTTCLRLSDRPGDLVEAIQEAGSIKSWYDEATLFMGGLLFHQEGMETELLPTLDEFNLVLEHGLVGDYDYLDADTNYWGEY